MESRKWTKQKLLVCFDLRSQKQLENNIHVFNINDFSKCIDDVRQDFDNQYFDYGMVILVPQNETQNLPKIIIKNEQDAVNAEKKLKSMDKSEYVEIWHGKSRPRKGIFGRQLIPLDCIFPQTMSSTLELLDGVFGRNLNSYPNISVDYARLEKRDRTYPFKLIEKRIQENSNNNLIDSISAITRKLSNYQKRIMEFGMFLKPFGTNCMSIDFNYYDDKLSFIDWDSGNDKKVLSRIEKASVLSQV